MTPEAIARRVRPGARVVVAALVPAVGDEDRPRVEAVERAVDAWGAVRTAAVLQRRGISKAKRPGGAEKRRDAIHPATFFGSGKVGEIAVAVRDGQAECVVVANPLFVRHVRNLEAALGVPVYDYAPSDGGDRTELWVDASNELYAIVGESPEERRAARCLLPDGRVVDGVICDDWFRDSVYGGWRVRVTAGWVEGGPGVIAARWRDAQP